MVDHVTRERRSVIMGRIRGTNTSPEIAVRKAAHSLGLRFRLHGSRLPGRPDLVFPRWRTVIFVNGCFWHRHPGCRRTTTPKSNTDFWKAKFAANVERDVANYRRLAELGWRVLIVWGCEARTPAAAATLLRKQFKTGENRDA